MEELPTKFESLEMKKLRQEVLKELEEKKFFLIRELEEEVKELGFEVSMSDTGLSFLPIDEEADISADTLKATTSLAKLVIEEIHVLEEKAEVLLENIIMDKLIYELSLLIKSLKVKYRHYEELDEYFDDIFDDIVDNAQLFTDSQATEVEALKGIIPIVRAKGLDDIVKRYEVNVLVDNEDLEGATTPLVRS